MLATLRISQWTLRIAGILALILGITIWAGYAQNLLHAHILLGGLVVLALWLAAGIALLRKAGVPLAIVGIVWGLLVLWLGMKQMTLMSGSMHWIIRVVHLLLGLGAMGLGEALVGRIKHHAAQLS